MTFIKTYLIGLFFAISFACSSQIQTSQLRETLVESAEKYVGVREETGKNDGKQVENILRNVGLRKGYAWCAALMTQVHDDINIPNPRSAWSPNWFQSNVVFEKYETSIDVFQAKKGQVFGLYIEYKKRVGHVGMIIGESRFSYITIEGNTSGESIDEGDGCYRKIRNKRMMYVISDYCMSKEEKKQYLNKQ